MVWYLVLSCGLNIVAAILVAYLFFRLKSLKKKPELTKDATKLLSELMRSGAVVVTQVIDPGQLFMYSPRDMG